MIHDTQSAQISQKQDECNSCVRRHELPQSHCGDNREGTCFSWLHFKWNFSQNLIDRRVKTRMPSLEKCWKKTLVGGTSIRHQRVRSERRMVQLKRFFKKTCIDTQCKVLCLLFLLILWNTILRSLNRLRKCIFCSFALTSATSFVTYFQKMVLLIMLWVTVSEILDFEVTGFW